MAGANRYPDPTNAALRRRLADRHGVPAGRIAIGNGSCDILLAAGDALLEPGAELVYAWPSFSVYPHLAAASGARAIEVPLDDAHRHDLEAMREEITVATRLVIVCNPNNPTSTALPLDEIAAFVADVPRHVCVILDEAYCEFNLLAGPRRVGRAARQAPEPRAAADVLARSTGCAGCGSATGCAARRSSAPRSTRCASRSSATPPPRPRRSRRSATRTRSPAASSATWPSGSGSRTGCASWASSRPSRRPTSSGSTSATAATRPRSCAGLAERGVLVRAGARARPRGRAARHGRHAGRERALPGGARRAALMELATRPPHPALAPHIRSLAGWHERADGPVRRAELPGGRIVLVISFGPKLDVERPQLRLVRGRPARRARADGARRRGPRDPGVPDAARRPPPARDADGRADPGGRGARRPDRPRGATSWPSGSRPRRTGPTRFDLLERAIAGAYARRAAGRARARVVVAAPARAASSPSASWRTRSAGAAGISRRPSTVSSGMAPKALARLLRFERGAPACASRGRPGRRRARQRLLRPGALQPRLPRLRGRDPDRVPGHIRPRRCRPCPP